MSRQSLRVSRASIRNDLLDDPMIAELVTENEMMLMEIECLRQENDSLKQNVADITAGREQDAIEHQKTLKEEVERTKSEMEMTMQNKVAMLRTILNSLTQFQFEMEYFRSERVIRPGEDDTAAEADSRSSGRASAAASRPQRLADVNQRYQQLYQLITSYQRTPSFASNPYDALVLDALNQIVALNKTLNAVTFARVELEGAEAADTAGS